LKDKREIYNSQISHLVSCIYSICEQHNIPFNAVFEVSDFSAGLAEIQVSGFLPANEDGPVKECRSILLENFTAVPGDVAAIAFHILEHHCGNPMCPTERLKRQAMGQTTKGGGH